MASLFPRICTVYPHSCPKGGQLDSKTKWRSTTLKLKRLAISNSVRRGTLDTFVSLGAVFRTRWTQQQTAKDTKVDNLKSNFSSMVGVRETLARYFVPGCVDMGYGLLRIFVVVVSRRVVVTPFGPTLDPSSIHLLNCCKQSRLKIDFSNEPSKKRFSAETVCKN